MTIKIILKAIIDGLHGFRMMFLSGRRDRFGYIAPSAKIYPPFYGTKENRGKPQSSDEKNGKFTVFSINTKEEGLRILKNSENTIYDYINMLCDNSEDKSITFDNLKFFVEYMKKRM